MTTEFNDRFEILRQLAVAGSLGQRLQETAEMALRQAAALVRLKAASLYLWDNSMVVTTAVSYAEDPASQQTLVSLEQTLFSGLRKERQMTSAYLSFAGDPPTQTFTLPLHHAARVFGAVIGVQQGKGRLISDDVFLEALSATLSLYIIADEVGVGQTVSKEQISKERLGAIQETAVTVNHEINNPLTAILGNVQLLLMKRKDLDDDLVNKLRVIETSALKIKDITQKLLRINSPRSVDYAEGTRMLDLSDDSQ